MKMTGGTIIVLKKFILLHQFIVISLVIRVFLYRIEKEKWVKNLLNNNGNEGDTSITKLSSPLGEQISHEMESSIKISQF